MCVVRRLQRSHRQGDGRDVTYVLYPIARKKQILKSTVILYSTFELAGFATAATLCCFLAVFAFVLSGAGMSGYL